MRLLKFTIGNYRVLRDLTVNFTREDHKPNPQEGYALDFLAGVNGTGKSTVLHLLGRLFAWLEKDDWFPVPIDLEYELKDSTRVRISNLPQGDETTSEVLQFRYWLNDEGPYEGRKLEEQYLPRHIVMYTTGEEAEWQSLLALEEDKPQSFVAEEKTLGDPASHAKEWYLHELPRRQPQQVLPDGDAEGEIEIPQRILFIQQDRLPAVALCGLLTSRMYVDEEGEVLRHVLRSVDIEQFAGFSLRCRVHKGLISPKQGEIVESLARRADRIIRQGADQLLVFDLKQHLSSNGEPIKDETSVFGIYDSPLQLFQSINALYEHRPFQDAPLQEVNMFFKRARQGNATDEPMLHLWEWLSDGERSFLARMALFTLFRDDDILILLDEPEVHFNDAWKREIVNMLDQIMRGCQSHALVTTHSSIALTDVPRDKVLVLARSGMYTQSCDPPGMQTLGADPSDIMVHVFATRYAAGARSVGFIREQIGRARDQEELRRLKNSIAPGYWRYRVQLEIEQLGVGS